MTVEQRGKYGRTDHRERGGRLGYDSVTLVPAAYCPRPKETGETGPS